MRRKRRSTWRVRWLAVAAVAAYAAVVAAAACQDGSETTGVGGAAAGTGGTATTTSSATTSTTASGAVRTVGGGYGGAGSDPIWEPLGEPIVSCTLERMSNAAEVRMFHWEPCGNEPSCQAMVINPVFGSLGHTTLFLAGGVQETDIGPVLSIGLGTLPDYQVVFAKPDGWLIDGYKLLEAGGCYGALPGSNRTRYGFEIDQGTLPHRLGGLLNALDQSETPVPFEMVPTPGGIGPQIWQAWGDERWVWQFYPDRLDSISVQNGGGIFTMAASETQGPILAVNYPTTAGPVFYFEQVNLVPPDSVQGIIAQSNGVEPSSPYLVPPDASYYGRPVYAHSHIGWFRGIGQTGVNKFAAVEVWASAYSADPAALSPYKVDDYAAQTMEMTTGGYGYFVAPSVADPPVFGETAVWRLSDNTKRIFVYPGGRKINRYLGVTQSHVWVVGRDLNVDYADMIVRFAL